MKTKNKQNPGNKQTWLLASFAYLPGLEIMYIQKEIKPGEFDI